MAKFAWNERYEIGIPSIDMQHRELAGLVGRMEELLTSAASKEDLQEAFDLLAAATARHFRYEEEQFAKTAFPRDEEHRREHGRLLLILTRYGQSLDAALLSATSSEHATFLSEWFVNHIATEDRALGAHLAKAGVR